MTKAEVYADVILMMTLLVGMTLLIMIDPTFATTWAVASCLITWLNGG